MFRRYKYLGYGLLYKSIYPITISQNLRMNKINYTYLVSAFLCW